MTEILQKHVSGKRLWLVITPKLVELAVDAVVDAVTTANTGSHVPKTNLEAAAKNEANSQKAALPPELALELRLPGHTPKEITV